MPLHPNHTEIWDTPEAHTRTPAPWSSPWWWPWRRKILGPINAEYVEMYTVYSIIQYNTVYIMYSDRCIYVYIDLTNFVVWNRWNLSRSSITRLYTETVVSRGVQGMKQTRQKSQLVSVEDDPLIMDWWIRSWQGHNVNLPRTTSNTRCAHWSCGGTWCTAQWASDWCYSGLFPRNRMRSIYSPEVEPSFYLPHFFFNQLQMSFQQFAKDVNPSDIRSLISSDEMHSQAMVTNRWVFFCPTKIRRCRNYFYYFSVMENTS